MHVIKMFEASEPTGVEQHEDADHLAVAHHAGSLGFFPKNKSLGLPFKHFAKFMYCAKNFGNFVVSNHSENV